MHVLSALFIALGCLSMFSCSKTENLNGDVGDASPTLEAFYLKKRVKHPGQYNFTVEVDTSHSSTGILSLKWGNASQEMELTFTNPSQKVEYSFINLKHKVTKQFWLTGHTSFTNFHFEIFHEVKGSKIYFNGKLIDQQEHYISHLNYFKFDSYGTYDIASYSIKY